MQLMHSVVPRPEIPTLMHCPSHGFPLSRRSACFWVRGLLTFALLVSARAAFAAGSSSSDGPLPPPPNTNALDLLRSITHPAVTNPPMPRFETWPIPPPRPVVSNAPAAPPKRTPLAQAAGDKTLYSFHAEGLDMKAALALFARANKLNIVPDLDVAGLVTLDVRDLPLERLMQALLEAHDLAWTEEGGLIRVRTTQTQSHVVDYLRMTRDGQGSSQVTLSSSSTTGGGGGGTGGGGLGGGGGGGAGGAGGGGGAGAVPAAPGQAGPR